MFEFLKKKKINLEKEAPPLGQLTAYQPNRITLFGKTPIAYNPDCITLPTYNEMRNFDTIAGAIAVNKFPIMSADWYIDGSNKARCDFVEKNLRPLFSEFMKDMMLALPFGFSAFEKVLDYDSDMKIIYKKLINLNPQRTDISVLEDGTFNGLLQLDNPNANETIHIPANKSFVYTREKEFGNFYGRPITRGAYTPWYIIRYALEFTSIYYEKYGSPTLIGYAPNTQMDFNGKKVNTLDYMLDVLKSIQNASAITLPHSSKNKDELEYFIDVLESKRTGADYISFLKYLDQKMFVGALCPSLSYGSGEKGSYNLAEEQMSSHAQRIDGELTCIKEHIDKYIIKPLIAYNFSDSENDDTNWSYSSVAKRDKELTRQILLALIQRGDVTIAKKYLIDALGMPAIEAGEKLDEIAKEVNAPSQPPNGQANQQPVQKPTPEMHRHTHKIQFKRKPNELEKHINFEKIKERYDDNEKEILAALYLIISKQQDGLSKDIKKAIENGNIKDIQNMSLRYQGEYESKVVELSKQIFEQGKVDVESEMDLDDTPMPAEAKAWVIARAKNIAKKHLSDLEFLTIGAALTSISKDLSGKQIIKDVNDAFKGYTERQLEDSAIMTNHKMYNEGREWTAEENGIKFAEWSAVLDDATCPYCESRDGMIIDVNDPDFTEFSPGNVHERCRCIWIYLQEEYEPTWKTPSKSYQEQYYMTRRVYA